MEKRCKDTTKGTVRSEERIEVARSEGFCDGVEELVWQFGEGHQVCLSLKRWGFCGHEQRGHVRMLLSHKLNVLGRGSINIWLYTEALIKYSS